MHMLRVVLGLMLIAVASLAHAEKRVALVIGNSAYEHVPALANPKNDASDMAAKLESLGFEVVRGSDLNLTEMRKTAREFIKRIEGADLSLFFYAGHGLQVNGNNYMAPVDAQLASFSDLDFETFSMDLVLSAMERNTKTSLIFLDACRDNPLADNLARSMGTRSTSVGRGLAKLGSGVGSLIAFATQPGNVALDGKGRNSPFTTALLNHLGTPGQSVTDDLIHVRKEVLDATEGKQVPWENSSLTGPVILKEKPKEEPKPVVPVVKVPAPADNAVELAYWETIKDARDKAFFEGYLAKFPKGLFADVAKLKIALLGQGDVGKDEQADKDRRLLELKAAEEARLIAEKSRLEAEKKQAALEAEEAARLADQKRQAEKSKLAEKLAAEAKAKVEIAKTNAVASETIVVASLEQPNPNPPEAAQPPADTGALALSIQKELARVGCLSGKADGIWGSGSERALKDYAGRQGVKLASLQPSAETLERLKTTKVRVCPLVCGKGLEEKNGRCEKQKREVSLQPKPEREKVQPKPEQEKVQPKKSTATPKAVQEKSEKYCMAWSKPGASGSTGSIGRKFVVTCTTEASAIANCKSNPRECKRVN